MKTVKTEAEVWKKTFIMKNGFWIKVSSIFTERLEKLVIGFWVQMSHRSDESYETLMKLFRIVSEFWLL